MHIYKVRQTGSGFNSQSFTTRATFGCILFGLIGMICLISVAARPCKYAKPAGSERSKRKLAVKKGYNPANHEGPHLYDALIRNLINVQENAEQKSFRDALMQWQRKNGLPISGQVDNVTWISMKNILQAQRIKDKQPPLPGTLAQIAEANLYDPQRPQNLRYVERETYAAYELMIEAAYNDLDLKPFLATNNKYLKIISAYRSADYQSALRRSNPGAGRGALALNSPHSTGRTLDLYVGGDPVSSKYANRALQMNTRVYKWLARNAAQFGFVPYYYEPWHWEYRPK